MTTSREFRHYSALFIAFMEAVLLIALARGYDQWRGFALGLGIAFAVMTPLMLIAEVRLDRKKSALARG